MLAERCFPATQPLFIAIGDNAFEQVLEPVPGSGDVRWQYTPSPEIPPVHASIRFGKSRSDCVNPDVQRDRDDIALDVATYTFSNCYKPGETITFEADPPTLVAYLRVLPRRSQKSADCREQRPFTDGAVTRSVVSDKETLYLSFYAQSVVMNPEPIKFQSILAAAQTAGKGPPQFVPARDLTYAWTVQKASGTASPPTLSSAEIDVLASITDRAQADFVKQHPDKKQFVLKIRRE